MVISDFNKAVSNFNKLFDTLEEPLIKLSSVVSRTTEELTEFAAEVESDCHESGSGV